MIDSWLFFQEFYQNWNLWLVLQVLEFIFPSKSMFSLQKVIYLKIKLFKVEVIALTMFWQCCKIESLGFIDVVFEFGWNLKSSRSLEVQKHKIRVFIVSKVIPRRVGWVECLQWGLNCRLKSKLLFGEIR